MPRLIDAERFKDNKFHLEADTQVAGTEDENNAYWFKAGWNSAIEAISEYTPTVDAVEVVKCKDCIYQAECAFTEWLGRNGNGFCSCGERREDAEAD